MSSKIIKRKKRGDTKMGTIEKKYGYDFGVRADMKLSTYLKKSGQPSLSKILQHGRKKR
jgi:hypothetical protein